MYHTDLHYLQLNATKDEQVDRLLSYLTLLDDQALELFRRCLVENNQAHVLQILDNDDGDDDGSKGESVM